VGSLRTMPADRWTCKVPSCTGGFHRLKDCRRFHKMEPEDRLKLADLHSLCLGCLTPGHGRAARACPYEEEQADACKRTACRRRHHHLLHVEERKAKKGSGKNPPARSPSPLGDPTPMEDLGCEVQLVAQWVSTKVGASALVFWDTVSQVTLITQKMARALGLVAIPSSPLRLEGIGEGHRPRAATRFKILLVDTGGRAIAVTAYGVDVIMSPLVGGDVTLMREMFPEVPAGGLVSASGEVSLLMGQDNLSLFPVERRRVGNAALYMSRFGFAIRIRKATAGQERWKHPARGSVRHQDPGARDGEPAGATGGGCGDLRGVDSGSEVGGPAPARGRRHLPALQLSDN
jgi:hypothetical protein